MFAVIVANLIRYAVAQGGGGNGAVVLHVQGCTREARAVPPARFHWGDAWAAAIVAMFPVRWERGTGTRDESRWLKKIGYNEGIHLSNDFFIAGTRSNPFGYDEPGTVPWVEERSS